MRRIRLGALLPFAVLLSCLNLIPLWTASAAYEAAGIISASAFVAWGAVWHFTAGIILPALAAGCMEAQERHRFLMEEKKVKCRPVRASCI